MFKNSFTYIDIFVVKLQYLFSIFYNFFSIKNRVDSLSESLYRKIMKNVEKMIKTNAMRIVETAKIPYKVYEYEVTDGVDAKSVAQYLQKPEEQVFKTLVTQAPNDQHGFEYFVFVIPANAELSVKKAAHAAGVKNLEMLPLKKLLPLTGYVHGGCSPLGMKKQFPVFIDETAILFDTFCLSGGKIGVTLELNAEALATAIGAKFADLTL